MLRSSVCLSAVLGLAFAATTTVGWAQETPAAASAAGSKPDNHSVVFRFSEKAHLSGRVQLINGTPVTVRTRDWPTIVIANLSGIADNGFCTATLVGPGVFLMAAHCLDQRTAELREAFIDWGKGKPVLLACQIHPDYLAPDAKPEPTPRHSQDYGLCHADPGSAPQGVKDMRFEVVDTGPVLQQAPVLMMGYGCTDLDKLQQDKILRVGDASITAEAGRPGEEPAYARITSPRVPLHGPPVPALCQGDSGGPLLTGANMTMQTLSRRVRGVNSSVQDEGSDLVSRVAMLSYPGFAAWARNFVGQYTGAYICGLDPTPAGARCRN